jgi:hypothetical protein
MRTRKIPKFIQITQNQLKKLQDIARERGLSESEIIGQAIDHEFDLVFGLRLLGTKSNMKNAFKKGEENEKEFHEF